MSRSALNKHMKKEQALNGDKQGNEQIHCKETSCSFKCRHLINYDNMWLIIMVKNKQRNEDISMCKK